jgi:S-adenosylmethionine hydrolase
MRITLLTDFGTADGYVGAMKGVIAAIAPAALIDDISHEVPAADINSAAQTLSRYFFLYPVGSVHVVVVDPGVGSARRALAARLDDRVVVAPDNGILTIVLAKAQDAAVHVIANRAFMRETVSPTFHGRDIFAPCAAHLAAGLSLKDVGPPINDPVKLSMPRAVAEADGMRGEVIHVDRFGNLITNIPGELARGSVVHLNGREIGHVRHTYADVAAGTAVALIGSEDSLEIAVRGGNAAETLGAGIGAEVSTQIPG